MGQGQSREWKRLDVDWGASKGGGAGAPTTTTLIYD